MTSNWQRCFPYETIPENNRVTPSLLRTPHFVPFVFSHSHFPHSALSILLIFHTPHFRHSSLSALSKFYTPHSVYFTELSSRFNFRHLSLFCSQIDHRKQRKALLQDLLEVFLEFTPNTASVKDYCFGPKARSGACTAAG